MIASRLRDVLIKVAPTIIEVSTGERCRYAAAPLARIIAPASEMKSRSGLVSPPRKRWKSAPPTTPIAIVITAHSVGVIGRDVFPFAG